MTWGVSNEKPAVQAYNPEAGIVAVQGEYAHLPKKSVLTVASMVLISGILCILLGICHEVLMRDWRYMGIGTGIMFAITGILGTVSVFKRTKGRFIATAVLAIICCLCSTSMGMSVFGEFCGGKSNSRDKRGAGRHSGGRRESGSRGHSGSGSGEDDYDWHGNWRAYKAIFGINIVFIFLCALVFCCSIALAVFVLKTVTSPKGADQGKRGPVLTPVVSFPPSKDPNQLDSFNGN